MSPSRIEPWSIDDAMTMRDERGVDVVHERVLGRARGRDDNTIIALDETKPHTPDGPLHGIPFAVKDNIDCVPFATTGGSPHLASFRPKADAPPVAALKALGGYVPIKPNLHELAFGITSNNAAYGPVRNPFDRERVAGGSSGGNAVAIACGIVPFALGTDTGGSTRIPAAFCGIAGFRPSTGRYADGGVLTLSTTRDTIGPMAATCADVAKVDAWIVGDETPLSPPAHLRIGLMHATAGLSAAVDTAMAKAFTVLENSGFVEMVPLEEPFFDDLDARFGNTIALCEAHRVWTKFCSERLSMSLDAFAQTIASPDVRAVFAALPDIAQSQARAYRKAITEELPHLRSSYADLFAHHELDLIAMPTVRVQPPLIGEDETMESDAGPVPTFSTVTANTALATLTGGPSLSIPTGLDFDRLPVSFMIEGLANSDRDVLAAGIALERLLG